LLALDFVIGTKKLLAKVEGDEDSEPEDGEEKEDGSEDSEEDSETEVVPH